MPVDDDLKKSILMPVSGMRREIKTNFQKFKALRIFSPYRFNIKMQTLIMMCATRRDFFFARS